MEDYQGPRTADGIVEYMLKMNDPNWTPPPSQVAELVSENFTQYVKNKELSLIMWHAPWCKHCKQVMPGKSYSFGYRFDVSGNFLLLHQFSCAQ